MSPRERRLLIASCAILLFVATPIVVAGVLIAHSGVLVVQVDEFGPGGDHVRLRIPCVLVDVACRLAPREVFADARLEGAQWIPAVRAALTQLAKSPDCVLVQVDSSDEKVRIEKRNRTLLVKVDSLGERIRIEMPLRSASMVLSRIEKAALS